MKEKKKINKKALRILIIVLASILAVALLCGSILWVKYGRFIMAARSVTMQEANFYSLEFKGDYGFDEFLEKGGADSDEKVGQFVAGYLSNGKVAYEGNISAAPFGCSVICAENKAGNVLFGRNYDWEESTALVVHTVPKNGYASVSTCCLDFLGFGDDYVPDASMTNRMKAIAAIYVPLDGMNEKGLMVADLMAGDNEQTAQQTDKPDLTTTTALRLLLDRAATVDEALELLRQYDMHSSVDFAHHFAIADASGKSVAVEYVNNEMVVTETKVLTNHYLAAAKGKNGGEQSRARYEILKESAGKTLEGNDMVAVLESVAQKNFTQTGETPHVTVWSWVYSPNTKTASFFFREKFFHAYRVSLYSSSWLSPQ